MLPDDKCRAIIYEEQFFSTTATGDDTSMTFDKYFPIWDKLSDAEKETLNNSVSLIFLKKGEPLRRCGSECLGLTLVRSGQIRTYITSEDGREITLYRLLERDMCLFSANCIMQNIQFDVLMAAEKDTWLWIIPPYVYKTLMETSIHVANYTNQLMASHFSEAMWMIEQVMWKSFDKRLAAFLIEESGLEDSYILKITHEKIADHLGSAREVVTRMLRHFQADGLVKLSRGTIAITDIDELMHLSQ